MSHNDLRNMHIHLQANKVGYIEYEYFLCGMYVYVLLGFREGYMLLSLVIQ